MPIMAMSSIICALVDLGYTYIANMECHTVGYHRIKVTLNDEYIGIWDTDKNNFADRGVTHAAERC